MASQTLEVEIQSTTDELGPLRDQLRKFLEITELDAKDCESVLVAMGEGCTNAIRHSYHNETGHKIHVKAENLKDRIVFKIRDFGEKINLAKLKKPKIPPDKPGGLGVYFMQTIMDLVEYNTQLPEGNEVTLVKYKKGELKS